MLAKDYQISLVNLPLDTKLSCLSEQDASFDSLNLVAFLVDIENEFDIELPIKLSTLGELLNELEKRDIQ